MAHISDPLPIAVTVLQNDDHCYASSRPESSEKKSVSAPDEKQCPHCQKKACNRKALFKHKKKYHPEQLITVYRHRCDRCPDFWYNTVQDFVLHCKSHHCDNLRILKASFRTKQEFEEWKREKEKATSSRFIKASGPSERHNISVSYYYCSRSGFRASRIANPKRAPKAQGSSKIGKHCTAFVTARLRLKDGRVDVRYCFDHTAHGVDLAHLPLSNDIRNKIATKLAQGTEVNKILRDLRQSMTEVNRDSLVTKRDIYNIRARMHVPVPEKLMDNDLSIDLWVQRLKEGSGNPVIFYKPQGTSHNTLHDGDFLLCLQTPFQKEIMRKFHSKMICIDSTHASTRYDFVLSTALVLTESEEGMPVAWAVSNRRDIEVMTVFLTALKSDKDFKTETFMSDLPNDLYDAWCSVFPKPKLRLACPWHVDKSLRNQLNKLIPSQEIRQETYSSFKMLQTETSKSNFHRLLQNLTKYLSEKSEPFLEYFNRNYVMDDRFTFWAACFRSGSHAYSNMRIEAFHRALKDIYCTRKHSCQVNSLLVALLQMARDKAVEQLAKGGKRKVQAKIQEIRKTHNDAEAITGIVESSDCAEEWSVPSQSVNGLQYNVKKVDSFECSQCKLVCDACNVCIHMYKCTCPYFLTHPVVCKHIHAVHMRAGQSDQSDSPPDMVHDETRCETDSPSFNKSVVCQGAPEITDHDREQLLSNYRRAANLLTQLAENACRRETIETVTKGILDVLNVGTEMEEDVRLPTEFPMKRTLTSTQNFEVQCDVFSASKKSRLTLNKLHNKDMAAVMEQEALVTCPPTRCAVCLREDNAGSEPKLLWLQCASCSSITTGCSHLGKDNFKCPLCIL